METSLQNYFIQSREQLDNYLRQIDFLAYTVMFSSWVQQLIDYRSAGMTDLILYQTNVQRFLKSLSIMNNDISMVLITNREIIYSNNPIHTDTRYDITKEPWFGEFVRSKKHAEYGYGGKGLFGEYGDTWSLTLFYTITNINSFNTIGYFVVNIPAEKFDFLLNDLLYDWIDVRDSNGYAIIDSPSGNFPAGNNTALYENITANYRKYNLILYEDTLLNGNWHIRLYRRLPDFSIAQIKSYYLFLLLLIPILGIFSVITFTFSRYLTNPILRCKNAMLEIQKNNFGVTLENHYRDEIGGLIDGFNEMSSTLVTLRQENIEIEKSRREAEIEMLQQKVNPHFLYNTLEIINALIMDGQHGEAVQVCELLGQIYHFNMMSNKWVSLRDETEYVKRYLKMLQYKMNSLSVVWEISEEAMETDCLRFILQPLVENVIRHGFRQGQNDACLTLSVESLPAGRTEIRIMDNGAGIDSAALSKIEETLAEIRRGNSPPPSHIGIPNVYQRLYLEYGEVLGFSIESRPDFGTKITITIPFHS